MCACICLLLAALAQSDAQPFKSLLDDVRDDIRTKRVAVSPFDVTESSTELRYFLPLAYDQAGSIEPSRRERDSSELMDEAVLRLVYQAEAIRLATDSKPPSWAFWKPLVDRAETKLLDAMRERAVRRRDFTKVEVSTIESAVQEIYVAALRDYAEAHGLQLGFGGVIAAQLIPVTFTNYVYRFVYIMPVLRFRLAQLFPGQYAPSEFSIGRIKDAGDVPLNADD
jgi:hypothetical protein